MLTKSEDIWRYLKIYCKMECWFITTNKYLIIMTDDAPWFAVHYTIMVPLQQLKLYNSEKQ